MKIGPGHTKKEQHEIRDTSNTYLINEVEAVKICGISFSNSKIITYKENIINKIDKLSKQLNIWRQRNLTLQGKILIVKTFGLSQLIYSLQSTHIDQKELKEIDDHIYRFIWNTKSSSAKITHKIKRGVLISNYSNGGLNAPDIYSINEAIKYKHLIRSLNNDHPISNLIQNQLEAIGFKIETKITTKEVRKLSNYYQKSIKVHNMLIESINTDINNLVKDIDSIKIHSMYYTYVCNHQLKNSHFLNKMQNGMINTLNKVNISTYRDLHKEFIKKEKPHLWFEVLQLISSFPRSWRIISQRAKENLTQLNDYIPIKENLWKQSNLISLKEIVERVIQNTKINDINSYIKNKHKLTTEMITSENPFMILRKSTKEEKLKNVQFKILHNIYPTMSHLYKWKIKDTPNCHNCNIKETTLHAIFQCPIAKSLIDKFEKLVLEKFRITIKLSEVDMLIGISKSNYPDIENKTINQLNAILIILKRKLILQREEKSVITENELKSIVNNQIAIEDYIQKGKLRCKKS
jgi:hypothetical protein